MIKLDLSIIGLYVPENVEGVAAKEVVRYFDVQENPPSSGTPRVETTLSREETVERIATEYQIYTGKLTEFVEPETDLQFEL